MPEVTLLDFGFAGLIAGIAFKAMELAVLAIKNYNIGKEDKPKTDPKLDPNQKNGADRDVADEAAKVGRQALDQAKANSAKLDHMAEDVKRIARVLDGNGRPGMVENMIKMATLLDSHINDKGLHTSEK